MELNDRRHAAHDPIIGFTWSEIVVWAGNYTTDFTFTIQHTTKMDTFMTPFEAPNNSAIPSSSNTSGLFLPGNILVSQPFETPEPLPVEKLQMADLMKNPIVQELFSTVMENAAYQKKLFQQVNSLQAELASLKEVTARREPVVE